MDNTEDKSAAKYVFTNDISHWYVSWLAKDYDKTLEAADEKETEKPH